ncbi:MAG: 23S rRNA (adenine(2503)-C(2))-methyltransferase RlmN [Clostridiales bacterium]|nr:23S rRNA (adenine(2503)-C(2))-methyltransferase RlmN [Clostridiales bacterium]MBQ3107105.1 23S rRNA (adenine(2503)-C(2))-methyltransferase RlmN [Bacillota bacterium]
MNPKLPINDMLLPELIDFFKELGQPKFRAAQVFQWIARGAADFSEMTNLPAALRETLQSSLTVEGRPLLDLPRVLRMQKSKTDGTRKYLMGLWDGQAVESVFMKYSYGNTACISSQVGCRMACSFCASGIDGKVRDLTAGEMLGQILAMERESGEPISHVVIMGTGEPMDNYENVSRFLQLVHDPAGKNMSWRNITISTCGVIPGIRKLGKDFPQVNLAISLHASNDARRSALMPVNKSYPMKDLLAACKAHGDQTGRRVTFEYTLIAGVNDRPEDAAELASRLRGMLCHVNLIPLNKVEEKEFRGTSRQQAEAFRALLEQKNIPATVRRELGSDIDAACGQLRRRVKA